MSTTSKKATASKPRPAGNAQKELNDFRESLEEVKRSSAEQRLAIEVINGEFERENLNFVNNVTRPAKKPCPCQSSGNDVITIFLLGTVFGMGLSLMIVKTLQNRWY